MGGLLDRLESLTPQGKTYSVSARYNMDSPADPDRPQSLRHRSQWGGTPLESEREILHQTAVAYWLTEQNVWEPVIEGRSSLTLFKLTTGNDRLKVTVHRDSLSMELGVIWVSRVEVVKTDQTGVYWEDMRGRVWGVRFLVEEDTFRFLAACSPLDSAPGSSGLTANVRWVPPLPAERTESPVFEKRENESDEEDLLDSSLLISSGWKEGDLLKAVVEGFNSRNQSAELQDLDSFSFTQLLLSPDKELPQELSFDSHTSDGDKDSRKSDKSLSHDLLALHDSIDHFTQAFVSETTPVETTQPVLTENSEIESVADTEDSFEPVVIELEEGINEDIERRYSHNYDYQVDIETLNETLRRLDVSSHNRISFPGSRRSSLLFQQEKLIISPENTKASILRKQDLDESFLQTDVSSGMSESPSLARYSSLPAIPVSARLELETTSQISLNSFLQLPQPENLIVSSKSGWLEVSKLMYYKKKRLHLSTKNRWKRHWCCLRGASLLLYSRESSSLLDNDRTEPLLCLDLEGSLAQYAFECFKRNHVFTISLPNGHAYYMQAITQGEMIQWIQQLHCSAAIASTRQLNRNLAVEKLMIRCEQLEAEIEGDLRITERAESKILSTEDSSLKEKLRNELVPLVLSVELLQAELYRTNCYIASLNDTDLPTPDTFLSALSVTTKQSIKKLGLFTASVTYAFICENTTHSNQQFILKNSLFAALKEHSSRLSQIQTPTKRKKLKQILEILPSTPSELNLIPADSVSASKSVRKEKIFTPSPKDAPPRSVEIKYPDGEVSHIVITHSSLIIDVLLYSCINKNLDPQDYYVQINHSDNPSEHSSPSDHDYFRNHQISSLELLSKATHVIDLYPVDEVELGFSLEVLEKNIYGKFIQNFIVSQIIRGGQADIFGLELGDEVVSINNTSTYMLSLETVYSLLRQESVRIEFKTKRRKLPYSVEEIELINTLICPAPPASTSRLSTHEIGPLVIPNPKHLSFMSIRELSEVEAPDGDCEERDLLQTLMTESQELNYNVRLWDNVYPLKEGVPSHLSRLTQCCNELILTEKEFISALGLLTQRYLKSLQQESFVSRSEMVCLYENTKQVIARQNDFFSQLKSALSLQTDDQTSNLIIRISNLFVQHSQNFRLFSTFCTSYRNAQELINSNNEEVLAFLAARNPHNKHELRFDSLLALPIQRILRYPLFLRNMRDSVSKGSEEYKKISNAIQVLDRVAGYIDQIQYMSEKFSSLFNGILTESGLRKVGVHVDIAELKHKFDVTWLNPTEETGKWKKKGDGPEMTLFLLPRLLIVISYDNKFKLKLSKHGTIEYRELDDLVHYRLALLLFYCTFKDFPDSDGVSNMVSIGSQGMEQQVNLIIKCKSRPDKARLIREFKCEIGQINHLN